VVKVREKGGRIPFGNDSFTKHMNSDYDQLDLYFSEGEAGQIPFWDKFLHKKYKFALGSAKFILFILAQGPTNYYWAKRRPLQDT